MTVAEIIPVIEPAQAMEASDPDITLAELMGELHEMQLQQRAVQEPARRAATSGESPMRAVAAFFGFALAVIALGGFIIRTVDAATYMPPTASAPGGNVPSIIWNRLSSLATQTGAAIDIDGGVAAKGMNLFGATTLALTGTQNLVYGVAGSTSTPGSALMLLQTSNGTVATDRLRVDVGGNVTASGKMKSLGCFGRVFAGNSTVTFRPGAGPSSYAAADAVCAAQYAGSHVCRPEEMLESISCSTSASDPVKTKNGQVAWLHGGPPGYIAQANDCQAWTVATAGAYGRVWIFDTLGGTGAMTGCNTATAYPFACCQ